MRRLYTIIFVLISTLHIGEIHARGGDNTHAAKPTDDPTLVEGAAFIDRFLPLPEGEMSSDVWGAQCVIPRNIDNGVEDADYSYWGGNIIKGDDGKYYLFGARWPQDISRPNGKSGHMVWWNSDVYQAVSDKPEGPYKVLREIGKGHNPEIYRRQDGTYIIGVMGDKHYSAKDLNGEWEEHETKFDLLNGKRNNTNRTYIVLDDGTVYMMNKEGYGFNDDGRVERFRELGYSRAYHRSNGSHEEDPVVWRDEVEFNLVVNDCIGRIGYHLTSEDGREWNYEEGYAYTPDIVVNSNGVKESWHKLERPKVLLDDYGRPTHMNFAAVDTLKAYDLANDNHSSKNIVVPLRIERRMKLLSRSIDKDENEIIVVELLAEEDFNPAKDVNVESLRLGSTKAVNHAQGLKATKSRKTKNGLRITFKGCDSGIAPGDYKMKLLGKLRNNEPVSSKVKLTEN